MHTQGFKRRPLSVLVGLAAASGLPVANQSLAQDDLALEETVVTAQRVEEDLLDTPIAITTFDSRQLEEINATDLTDLNGYVPAFQAPPFPASSASPTIFIRGMGNVDVQTTKDAAVGVYLDGVVLGRVNGLALSLADLERIEVLRGPQGTLYGRNSTAGTVNYVTRKPYDELAAKARITVGNFNRLDGQFDVNIPVSQNIFLKFGYLRNKIDGWVENDNVSGFSDQTDPNKQDNEAATAALRWNATDNFTLDYAFDYSDMEYGNGYYQVVSAVPTVPGFFDNISTLPPTDDRRDEANMAKGFTASNVHVTGHNLTLNWDVFENITLKSITGYRELDSDLFQNYLDGTEYVKTSPDPKVGAPTSEFIQANQVSQNQFSQEFQVLGRALNDSIQYVGGLYYYHERSTEDQLSDLNDLNGFRPPAAGPAIDAWSVDAKAESAAVYGQFAWRPNVLSQRLGFTFGLRYTHDEREASKSFIRTALDFYLPSPAPIDGKNDFSNTSGQFIVDYFFTDSVNGYFKYATGYRAGGFNARAVPGDFEDGFDPEEVRSGELGFKSRLWDQRISVNAAAYYNQYDDLQVDAFVPPVNSTTINAGDSTIKGAEVEFIARLSRGWTLDAFYAYIDGEYGEYILPDFGDVADDRFIPNAPKNQAKVGAEYAFRMTGLGQVTVKVDYLWQDEFYSNPEAATLNDSYGLWNARLQWLDIPLPQGDIRLALWGKNLADEEYTILTTDFKGVIASQFGTPRTFGLDFIYQY